MITTITLNPSIDKRYVVDNFKIGGVFRVKEMQQTPGGKGLNVTRVINQIGEPVAATGFLGGKNGEFIKESLNRLGIPNSFITIKGEIRSCIAILSSYGSQTEVLESGPEISEIEIERFYERYKELIKRSSIIIASGSLPKSVPIDMYKDLITLSKKRGIKFILDTSGKALIEGIKAQPYLIKPNKEELEAIVGSKINSEEDLILWGKELCNNGIEIVVISLGGEGSLVFHKKSIYRVKVPKVELVNPVGSGDAMVAGFAVAIKRGFDIKEMISFASACGTANAMEEETGYVNLKNVKGIKEKILIEEYSI